MRRSSPGNAYSHDPRGDRSFRQRGGLTLGIIVTPVIVRFMVPWVRGPMFTRVHAMIATALDQHVGWRNLPLPLQLFTLAGLRWKMRQTNLFDTSTPATQYPPVPRPQDGRYLVARTVDGSYNDLDDVRMGSAGTRFGRNVPIDRTYPSTGELMQPSPRTVSRELLTREQFIPATTLNVLAAAWLQFMIRDWFSHGKSPKDNPWEVPIEPDDPWPDKPMHIMRTRPDPTRSPEEAHLPPTYSNTESPWWDGSQIYGSNRETQLKARAGTGGKLSITPEGFPPVDPNPDPNQNPIDQPGFWLGLALLRIVFTLEHNSICDRLAQEYPAWSDDDLFDKARLINAALLAKIHTVEWTTAILGHPALQIGMRANWWGIAGEKIFNLVGRVSTSEIISGIPGGPQDNFGVPYSLTEEFVAVYRMHPLIPDDYQFRSAANDTLLQEEQFGSLTNRGALNILQHISMLDLLYSFGVAHPGAVVLHNFPRALQNFHRPDGNLQDLAATDILRSRELGVPRYNEFRRLLHLNPISSWEDLTPNEQWRSELRRVYGDDVEQLDVTVGMFAETPPPGFGFSDTAFRIFLLMASRRLNSDRFFTTDFTERVYTKAGMDWLRDSTMSTVLLRHYPALAPALRGVKNAFAPWQRVTS
jgi:hypothetical protein